MKRNNLLNLLFITLLLIFAVSITKAQPGNPPPDGFDQQNSQPKRPNLLQSLGLTKQQIQQIRRINIERRPLMQEAKRRLDNANLALDEAIYGDVINESDIQTKLREVQIAHAEVLKNRTSSETEIRKVLTPEQLLKFRQLRQQFNPKNREINNVRQNDVPQKIPNRLKNLPRRGIFRRNQQNSN